MRSGAALQSDDWPAEMAINVQAYPIEMMELMFLRAAWNLPTRVSHDLSPAPRARLSPPADVNKLAASWDASWNAWWNEGTTNAPMGAPFSSRWPVVNGVRQSDADEMNEWIWEVKSVEHDHARREPERQVLPALTSAWRRGLRSVVVVPVDGYFDEWRGRDLVVSTQTRLEPGHYSVALDPQ